MSTTTSSRRRARRRLLAVLTATGVVVAGAGAPASALPTDSSEAAAQLIEADLLGLDLLDALTAAAGNPSGPGPDTAPVDAAALEGLATVTVGGVSLPLTGAGGLLDLGPAAGAGLLNGYAASPTPYQAAAASGAVGDDGTIDVSGVADPSDTSLARVALTPLLAQLGVGVTGVVDEVSLGLGALASSATQTAGSPASTDYLLAGAELTVSSPALAALTADLDTAVNGVDTTLDGVLGADGAVQDALDLLALDADVTVDVEGIGDVDVVAVDLGNPVITADVDLDVTTAGLFTAPLVGGPGGLVTLDLSTGTITVDLAQLRGGSLNGLPANTPLLTDSEITAITDVVAALLGDVTGTVTAAVDAAIAATAVTVDFDPTVTALAGTVTGDIDVTLTTTVGDLLAATVTADDLTVTGELTVTLPVVDVVITADALAGILATPVLNELVPAVAAPLTALLGDGGTLVEDAVGGTVSALLTVLDPALDAVMANLVDLTVNSQPLPGVLGAGSVTVRPLLVEVLPGLGGTAVALASSTVRVPAALPPAPTVTDLAPTSGPTSGGTVVTITGTGLDSVPEVTFGGVPGTGLTVAPDGTSLTVVAPPSEAAGPVPVVVTSPTGDAPADDFTYVAPAVTGISPDQGPEAGGTVVTLTGTGLDAATGVTFDGVPATDVTVADGAVTATTPAGAGVADVVVTLPGADAALADGFTYLPDGSDAVITDVTPDEVSTAGGTVVTIVGDGLEDAADVTFGGTPGTDVVVAPDGTSITVVAPPSEAAGPVDVVVVYPGGQVPAGPVTYVAPTVTGVDPAIGPTTGGTTVTITGTDLGATEEVLVDGVPATDVTVAPDGTSLTAVTPPGTAGTVPVTVALPGADVVVPDAFTYVTPPTLTGLDPSSGPVEGGQLVAVRGSGFLPGVTGVTFDGVASPSVLVVGPGALLAVTPPHAAGLVDVVVDVAGVTSDPLPYAYTTTITPLPPTGPAPDVDGITPGSGPTVGGTPVEVVGSGYVPGQTFVEVCGTLVGPARLQVSADGTRLTFVTPPCAAGDATVTVHTPYGTASTTFAYVDPTGLDGTGDGTGDGAGSGTGAGAWSGGGRLATTGGGDAGALLAALAMLALGAALVVPARRARRA